MDYGRAKTRDYVALGQKCGVDKHLKGDYKLRIKNLYQLNEGIKSIADKELPIRVAFLVQKNISVVEAEIKNAEAIRQKIIQKYTDVEATKKLKGQGKIQLQKDKLEEYSKEVNELMEQEVEVELKQININDLDGITVKPIVLDQIKSIITE
ncbi:MAG: hypothetical protein PHP06_11025 [Clostridia bacterium]|nr:hypothetical protein [Clostridia bacterium]